ncbi:MAG TPA: hypothetical protein VGJ22_07715, partial [Anaerolineales bacterium]
MPFALELEKSAVGQASVRVEPALNAFGSLLLFAKAEDDTGIHEWVHRTRARMSAKELFRHKLVMIGFHYAVVPRQSFASFPEYLAWLEQTPGEDLRAAMFKSYVEVCMYREGVARPRVNWDKVLVSAKSYVEFLKKGFDEQYIDEKLEKRAYEYVIEPDSMKKLITDHLRWFWEEHLEAEWTRVRPMIEKSVKAFQRVDLNGMPR